jgi:hypothetical protein
MEIRAEDHQYPVVTIGSTQYKVMLSESAMRDGYTRPEASFDYTKNYNLARKQSEVSSRYDNQVRVSDRGFYFPKLNYTPKQQRRVRKQNNKWRKRILGE